MLVIVVSECEKKAFTRSRRILNKYLFQYGRRTWMGRLSEEGQKAMRAELKGKASRHMAVVCHRVLGTRRTELAWVVGTRRHFSRTGEYAFAVTGRDVVTPVREKTMPERLVGHMAHLAGLLHDLGKSADGFQAKLRQKASEADAVRHDLLSALLLLRIVGVWSPDGPPRLKDLPADWDGQKGWLTCLTDSDYLQKRFGELAQEEELFPASWLWDGEKARGLRFLDPEGASQTEDRSPLLRWLLWLMMSHHRRPQGRIGRGRTPEVLPTSGAHIRLDAQAEADSPPFRRMAAYTGFWENDGGQWLEAVSEAADRLQRLVSAPGFESSGLFPLLEAHARPALLLADQVVSSQKAPTGELGSAEAMLANTTDGQAGQELGWHLTQIGRKASHFARLSLHRAPFPAIDADELPDDLRREPAPASQPERFRWQDHARLAIRDHVGAGIREGGGFYLVMAGTGRGKTVTIPKLLAELSEGGLRYSLGLGLRTLTLQSGDAYRAEVGFSEEQTATLVGSPLARQLHDLANTEGSESKGYADAAGESLRVEGGAGVGGLGSELRDFLDPKRRDPKLRTLIEAPVTVSTVDHLIGPLVERGTGSAAVQLRLMSTDLALDEIDQYDSRDLINIAKLVHLAGLYGRKVVLASATLPPAIAEHFYAAYHQGWQAYCRRVGQDLPLFSGWMADDTAIRRDLAPADFAAQHRNWVLGQTATLAETQPLRRGELVDVGPSGAHGSDLRPFFEAIAAQARMLHDRHHVTAEGRRVSLGLVRWMNVPMCREFARFLVDEADTDADLRVVCYHAQHMPATRYEIERVLDDLLNRKRDLPERLADQDDDGPGLAPLRAALEDGESKDLLIVVSATTVEDTGRDHDFDWAIWEPNDIRSAPQTAGRVFRHRPGVPAGGTPNVAILRRNWRSVVDGDDTPFRWPGPEGKERIHTGTADDRSRDFRVKDYADRYPGIEADPGDFGQAGPAELFRKRLDASPAIDDESLSPLADLEHDRLRWLLGPREGDPAFDGLAGYLASATVRATDFHVRASPFRGGPECSVEYALTRPAHLDDAGWPWQRREAKEREFGPAPDSSLYVEPVLRNRHRLLLQVSDHKVLIRDLAQRLKGDYNERIRDMSTIELVLYKGENPNRLKLYFDPDLGGRRGRGRFPALR